MGAVIYDAMTTAQSILKGIGVTAIEMVNVENACASGSTAVRCLWKDIAFGLYDLGIAVGVESMTTSSIAGKLIPPQKDDLDGHLGLTMPTYFALIARRLMETHGATAEDFAMVSVKNHHHGCLNPRAQYRKEFTAEQVLKSRHDCGSHHAASVLPEYGRGGCRYHVFPGCRQAIFDKARKNRSLGSPLCRLLFQESRPYFLHLGKNASRMAYEMAGIGPEDLDLIELHDAFACEEIIHYEDMGICKPGESIPLLRSGATALGGKIPVNPSGGLLSLGHPLAASGVRVIGEVALHLRGRAGKRQVPNAKVGMAQMLGGMENGLELGAAGIHILTI